MDKIKLGSKTAKDGFKNEEDVSNKFLNFLNDEDAKEWIEIFGLSLTKISNIKSSTLSPNIGRSTLNNMGINEKNHEHTKNYQKTDVIVEIDTEYKTYVQNISCKKAQRSANFNQVDKRKVDKYQSMWGFDDDVKYGLKLFTGEILHKKKDARNTKRLYMDEIPELNRQKIIQFFSRNKKKIVRDILGGRGKLGADWMLVTQNDDVGTSWVLKNIDEVVKEYSAGRVELTPRNSLKIGKITMQRKGGTPDPMSLQFKFSPLELFN